MRLTQRSKTSHEQCRKINSVPDVETLIDLFTSVLSRFKGEVFLVLDALDECPKGQERTSLFSALLEKAKPYYSKLHILATS